MTISASAESEETKLVDSKAGSDETDESQDANTDDESEEEIPENLSDIEEEAPAAKKAKRESDGVTSELLTEKVERRASASLPPLLSRLSERKPEKLNYIGVSFGATPKLLRYLPVYLRQTMVGH